MDSSTNYTSGEHTRTTSRPPQLELVNSNHDEYCDDGENQDKRERERERMNTSLEREKESERKRERERAIGWLAGWVAPRKFLK